MTAALGLIVWGGFGLPCLLVPFITPSPPVLLPTGALLTLAEAALIARAIWLARTSR
jgi:hypothetical protein